MTAVTIQKNTKAKGATPPPQPAPLTAAQKAAQTRKANQAKAGAPAKGAKPIKPAPAAQPENTSAPRVGRKQLAEAIYGKLKAAEKAVPQGILEIAVVAYEEAVSEALASGSEVQLPGFGKFVVVAKEAREGRNPKTGETVQIAAFNQVRFKTGAKLKASVNGGVETEGDDPSE